MRAQPAVCVRVALAVEERHLRRIAGRPL